MRICDVCECLICTCVCTAYVICACVCNMCVCVRVWYFVVLKDCMRLTNVCISVCIHKIWIYHTIYFTDVENDMWSTDLAMLLLFVWVASSTHTYGCSMDICHEWTHDLWRDRSTVYGAPLLFEILPTSSRIGPHQAHWERVLNIPIAIVYGQNSFTWALTL